MQRFGTCRCCRPPSAPSHRPHAAGHWRGHGGKGREEGSDLLPVVVGCQNNLIIIINKPAYPIRHDVQMMSQCAPTTSRHAYES